MKVIRNIYPAFSISNAKAYGAQEVVLETNPTAIPFGQLSVTQILRIFSAYQQRLAALRKLAGIQYVSIFHNDGLEAGASVKQTHSQIIATDIRPPKLVDEAQIFKKLKSRYARSPISRAMAWEISQAQRLIYNDRHIAVVCPYASQHPYEVWLVPNREAKSVAELEAAELKILAKCLKAVTSALNSEGISFNFYLKEQANGYDNHFMIVLTPRPNVWAGFELNTDIPINPVSPEDAAQWYRRFIEEHNAL